MKRGIELFNVASLAPCYAAPNIGLGKSLPLKSGHTKAAAWTPRLFIDKNIHSILNLNNMKRDGGRGTGDAIDASRRPRTRT
jgi:hypothetical protein